jgi:hypothetical protein
MPPDDHNLERSLYLIQPCGGREQRPITPATNRSVLVMGCCTTTGGVGQVSFLHVPSPGSFIELVGLESPSPSPEAITQGTSAGAGNHIVFIDYNHHVDIKTASIDTILVHNGDSGTRAGNVMLVW